MELDADNPLALEIRQEMAAAYFAACKKMVATLDALKRFDHDAAARRDAAWTDRRRDLLEEAAEQVFFVVIQREAMELPGAEEFFKDYDVPDEVRRRMGPKPRK